METPFPSDSTGGPAGVTSTELGSAGPASEGGALQVAGETVLSVGSALAAELGFTLAFWAIVLAVLAGSNGVDGAPAPFPPLEGGPDGTPTPEISAGSSVCWTPCTGCCGPSTTPQIPPNPLGSVLFMGSSLA